MNILQKILAVIRRELRIIRKRPVYIVGSVGVVVFCCVFFLTFFGKGLPDELPVGIVDNDNSTTSREFCEQFNSTQLSRVIRFDTFSQARDEMTRGNVFAVIVIPEGMNADVMANRQPHVSFYTNGLYFLGGALSWKNILQMVNLTCGAVQREVLRMKGYNEDEIMGMIRPVDIDTHQIGNPGTNYDYLLSGMLIPAMIAMCVMMILIYSLGAELKFGTSRHLLETSGGSMGAAVGGKCLLWTVIFSVLGCIAILVMYHWLGFPVAGSVWGMMLDMVLLIVSTEAVAVFIIEMIPVPRLALSIGALFSILSISMAGFSFPLEGMPRAIQALGPMFPLRHYYLFYVQEAIHGTGFAGWWSEAVHFLVFAFLPMLGIRRLEKAYIFQNYPKD